MWQSYHREAWTIFFSFGIILIASIVFLIVQSIKRLHDIGKDWKYVIYLLIPPPVNLIGFIWLAAKPGANGKNEYGLDPKRTDLV